MGRDPDCGDREIIARISSTPRGYIRITTLIRFRRLILKLGACSGVVAGVKAAVGMLFIVCALTHITHGLNTAQRPHKDHRIKQGPYWSDDNIWTPGASCLPAEVSSGLAATRMHNYHTRTVRRFKERRRSFFVRSPGDYLYMCEILS